MRVYSAEIMEDVRARGLLGEWRSDGLLTEEQYEELAQETVTGLRTTNVFLRVVLFLFTLLCVAATVGLFFVLFLEHSEQPTVGLCFLVFAALSYWAAEAAASEGRLYRHGIEEALAASSVGFLCAGLAAILFAPGHSATFPVFGVGAAASLWIWHRFGLWYMVLAAMVFTVFAAGDLAFRLGGPGGFPMWQQVLLAALYGSGLVPIWVIHKRPRFDALDREYSVAEALLWLGLYLAINLKIAALTDPLAMWDARIPSDIGFPKPFYWATWVLTWCLPPVVLVRGVRAKDRFVMGVGMAMMVMTFISNKPYLGWARHTWDPMLLGVFLTGAALYLRLWLAVGPDGVRHGFTAARLSGRDSRRVQMGASVMGLVTPHAMTPAAQVHDTEFKFGGGASGGGGAGGDF